MEVKIDTSNPNNIPDKLFNLTEKLLRSDKRYFGKAGVSLKNQLTDPKYKEDGYEINSEIVQLGIEGEKKISNILRHWLLEHPDIVQVDSLSFPIEKKDVAEDEGCIESLGDTDIVLLFGNDIIVIDAKYWKTSTTYTVSENGAVLRGKKPFKGGGVRAIQARELFRKFYKDYGINNIEYFICIANPKEPLKNGPSDKPFIIRDLNWWKYAGPAYKLVNEKSLLYFLDKYYEESQEKGKIRVDLLAKTLTGLNIEYDPVKEKWPQLHEKFS